ncbi:MAG: PIN domain-containing protein [Betaproteobacteria bacterium]
MIGLDTNVLVRLWVEDDHRQAAAARRLVAEHGRAAASLRIADAALLEAVWTLKSVYAYSRAQISAAVKSLLDEPAYALADRDRMRAALDYYRRSRADFGDCLIAVDNASSGCEFTATFDRSASTLPGMRAVATA